MPTIKARIEIWRERGLVKAGLAVCAMYLAFASAFTLLTPAWENNDERDHVKYIEYVDEHGTPPRIALENGIESHQPPLYYYLEAGCQRLLGLGSFAVDSRPPAPTLFSPTGPPWALSHDYTPRQRSQAFWVHDLRLVSLLCGLAAVLAGLATGWLLTGRLRFAIGVAATVALGPKFLVVTSAITNTALVDALCACAVPTFLAWERTRSGAWAVTTGLLLGAAALTQETALPIVGALLVLFVVCAWRSLDWRAPLLVLGSFLAISAWWYVRNDVLYGDPLASHKAETYLSQLPNVFGPLVREPPSLSLDVLQSSVKTLGHSTWYDAGFNQIQLPHTLNLVLFVVAGICIAAALGSRMSGWLPLAACAVASLIGWLLIIRVTTQGEGRYLLVAIVPWSALLVAGASHLTRNLPWNVGFLLWPGIMFGLDAYVIATWLIPSGGL